MERRCPDYGGSTVYPTNHHPLKYTLTLTRNHPPMCVCVCVYMYIHKKKCICMYCLHVKTNTGREERGEGRGGGGREDSEGDEESQRKVGVKARARDLQQSLYTHSSSGSTVSSPTQAKVPNFPTCIARKSDGIKHVLHSHKKLSEAMRSH